MRRKTMEFNSFITPMKSWKLEPDHASRERAQETAGAQMFKSVFDNAVKNVAETQADVENKQYLLATGQLEDAHSLPIAEAKAQISLDLMISLRNKSMEAYNELIKMQI